MGDRSSLTHYADIRVGRVRCASFVGVASQMDLISIRARARNVIRRVYGRRYKGYGPMPHWAKMNALRQVFVPGAPIIETGTYYGETSRYFAGKNYPVYTIEVNEQLSRQVFPGLRRIGVTCHCGDSAQLLSGILDSLRGTAVNLWLDGHWSGGITGRGACGETPIRAELDGVSSSLHQFGQIVVAIDDVRCFGNDPAYPDKRYLVDWACKNSLHFYFMADIFVATNQKMDFL